MQGMLELRDLFGAEARTAQPDSIERTRARRRAFRDHEWQTVLADTRPAAREGEAADAAKLMDDDVSRDDGALRDGDVSGKERAVGEHDAVADLAVVRDVRGHHEKAMVADPR